MQRVLFKPNSKLLNIKTFVAVSLLLHLLVLVAKAPSIEWEKIVKDEEHKITIKIVNPKTLEDVKNKRQIVQTEKTKNQLDKLKEAYLGAANNYADRETVSSNNGKFKKAGVGIREGANRNQVSKVSKQLKKKIKNLKFADLGMVAMPDTKMHQKKAKTIAETAKGLKNGDKKSTGLGRTNDYIEEVPLGDFTRLNTKEFEFYGFYSRIREKLEQFWGRNIQEQASVFSKSGRHIASEKNLITALVIFLNSEGEIVDVKIRSTSGVSELDGVAIKSFNQAGPFPNPPKKLIKDGKVKIEWSFVVNT